LEITPDQVQVAHFRVEYEVQRVVDAIRHHGLPESFAQMFLQGRNLDAVLDGSSGPGGPDLGQPAAGDASSE
jgi:hypothetical protein